MPYFALFYDVVPDHVTRRVPFRDEHLGLAQDAHRRGELVLAGALTDPVDRALLVFRVEERSTVEEFVRNDPLRDQRTGDPVGDSSLGCRDRR
jgi:uncharacterized protein